MLECVISGCDGQAKFLRSGSLHLLDVVTESDQVIKKMVWLCPSCTRRYVVQTWRPVGEQIQPRNAQPVLELAEVFAVDAPPRSRTLPVRGAARSEVRDSAA